MKKKRAITEEILQEISLIENISVSKLKNSTLFEIGIETSTTDIAEAVSILMYKIPENDPIWQTRIVDKSNILPKRSLFWLSGGYDEWVKLDNYKKRWDECFSEFEEEFGTLIIEAVSQAETFKDIKDFFIDNINLSKIYEFAIKKNLI